MPVNDKIKKAITDVVKRQGQPRRLAGRLGSLLDFLADAGPDVDNDQLGRRIDDVIEVVQIDKTNEDES